MKLACNKEIDKLFKIFKHNTQKLYDEETKKHHYKNNILIS